MDRIEPVNSARPREADGEQFAASIRLARRRLNLSVTIDERTARNLRQLRPHPKIGFWLFACGLIFLVWQRCPTAISHAAFWAEDGWVWYPQCYAAGWHCLFIDHSAYLQTISRLVALLSLLRPLTDAPKIFAVAALLIQAAPAIFLASPRMGAAIPALGVRLALALLLVAIPGMSEVYVNLTNSQWHLALLAFLILTANPAMTWPQRSFDTVVLLVSALSGPFAPFLLPVAILWCWRQPGGWQIWRGAIILTTALVQLSLVLLHQSTRGNNGYGLGWSVPRLINIVDTDIVGVAAFGRQTLIHHYWLVGPGEGWLSSGQDLPTFISGCIMTGAGALAMIACLRGRWILRAFLIFAGLEFAAGVLDGLSPTMPLWASLQNAVGMRYFFYPIAAWLVILVTLICDRNPLLRMIGTAIMGLTITVAIPADWTLPKLPRSTFDQEAKAFAEASPGTIMSFQIRPAVAHHSMVLVKR